MEQNLDLTSIIRIIKRRKHWLIWPFLCVAASTSFISILLPKSYKSTATILIQNQQIPSTMVPSTVTTFAEERIQTMTQEVTSRSKILNLVTKHNLLPEKREKLATEDLVEIVRKRIKIEPINAEINTASRGKNLAIAFSLSYEDEDPRKAQAVTNEISSYYMEKNLESRAKVARGTTGFLEDQLKQEKAKIDDLEARRAEYRTAHLEELPEFTALNMQKMEKLNSSLSDIHMQIRSLEEQRTSLTGNLALLDPQSGATEKAMSPAERLQQSQLDRAQLLSKYSEKHPDVLAKEQEITLLERVSKGSGKADQLRDKLRELQSKQTDLQSRYSETHPDVQSLKQEIDRVEKELSAAKSSRNDLPSKRTRGANNPAYVQLSSELEKISISIASLKAEGARVEEQMKSVYAKLQASPKVAKEYNEMETEYQIAKAHYNEIQQKLLGARVSQGMEEEQLGETFQVVEPAFLPEKPFKPNRLAIVLIGIVLGTGVSVGAASLKEFTDKSIRDRTGLEEITGVEVLSIIPRIFIAEDLARNRRRKTTMFAALAGSVAVSLIVFHFLVMDLYVFYAKLERFILKKVP